MSGFRRSQSGRGECAGGIRLLVLLLAFALLFTGCKVTFPERQPASSGASTSAVLSSGEVSSLEGSSEDGGFEESGPGDSAPPSSDRGSAAESSSTGRKPAASSPQTAGGGKTERPVSSAPSVSSTENPHSSESAPAAKQVCYIAIDCKTVAAKEEYLEKFDERVLPRDGVVLARTAVDFSEGETVYDVLQRIAKARGIVVSKSGKGSWVYIRGIGGLMEFSCGNSSGWVYQVNGVTPGFSCGAYKLQANDEISFRYTVELGDVS